MKRVAIATMGCKVNAYDTAHIRGRIKDEVQLVPFSSQADVYVINTCTVTNKSDSEARNLIRRSKRANPAAVTIVTGCYATTNAEQVAAVEGVDYVLGNAEKGRTGDLIVEGAPRRETPRVEVSDVGALADVRHIDAAMFDGRTRAYLKVQEGCMYRCTYCIIPYSRGGASRSVPLETARRQAEALVEAGYREIVLTGVHIGSWGHELGLELADLVEALAEVKGMGRVRISSIDSPELQPRLEELITRHPHVARHVHVPLQSGSDGVLRRMGRVYDAAQYREAVERLVAKNGDVCVGTDVIVGFPGETEAEFQETEDLLTEAPVHYFHVFTFSPRAGTPAAEMAGGLHGDVTRARSKRLRELGNRKKAAWAARFAGRTCDVLFERKTEAGEARGRAENYLEVVVPEAIEPGELHRVALDRVDAQGRAHGHRVVR